jgi:putative transposase
MFPRQRRPRPPLVLNEAERSVLLLVLNSERFADLAPAAVFAIFLDEGRYHGSVRTMYRFWAAKGLPGEHRKQQAHSANTFDILRGSSVKPSHAPAASELCD